MARHVVLGKSGTGKSWMLGKYLEEVVPRFPYAVHFDIEDEEQGLAIPGRDGSPPVFASLYIEREDLAGPEPIDIEATIKKCGKLRIVPDGLDRDEQEELFGHICNIAMRMTKRDDVTMHLSVDEAHNVIPNNAINDYVSRAVTGGRKRGLEWAAATQRAQKLHEDVLSQSNWGTYFQMTADSDLYKVDASIDAFSAHDKLPKLDPRECIIEQKETGEWSIFETESIKRAHPHVASDDGQADEFLEVAAEKGELHSPGGSDPDADADPDAGAGAADADAAADDD